MDWRQAPGIKARLACGYWLRAEAQGASPCTNICEHRPGFRADPSHLAILAAQRVDARALAADADARGWSTEADLHYRSPSDSTLSSPRQDDLPADPPGRAG